RVETEQFLQFWQPVVDEVIVRPLHAHGGRLGGERPHSDRSRPACRSLWDTGVISWRGELKLCCLDWESQAVVGRVGEHSVEDLWTGEVYARVRRLHLRGDYETIPLCARCPDFRQFGWPLPHNGIGALTGTKSCGGGLSSLR
ncbi:MAG: SPASM domain-containing protein, partial [Armatimonadota bacterium]